MHHATTAILAVALSLTKPADYTYTTPVCSSNQIVGVGMGEGGDYTMLRAEDVAFLREAYAERTDVPFAFKPDATNAIDRPIPIRPRTVNSAVFEDGDWGGCFSLSYTGEEMPYSRVYGPGSFVRDGFRFGTSIFFEEVDAFPATQFDEFAMLASNAVARGYAFTTNEIPSTWWDRPYVMTTNHIRSLYASLPLFNVAALKAESSTGTHNRETVFNDRQFSDVVAEYHTDTAEYEDEYGHIYSKSYHSGYKRFRTTDTNTEYRTAGTWTTGIGERRWVSMCNEFAVMENGPDGPWPTVVLGNYKRTDNSRRFVAVSNCHAWVESPVKTNAQDSIEILQTVLDIHLTYTLSIHKEWNNPSIQTTSEESTNIVRRAVMWLPAMATLDKSAGLTWNGSRWKYKIEVPTEYLYRQATRLFGNLDDHFPTPAQVEDSEIAAAATGSGNATGDTIVEVSLGFSGSRIFMVYDRTYTARTLPP